MPAHQSPPELLSPPPFDAQQQILALAEQICRMLAIAGAMVASGRSVDLAGLRQHAGLLCAKALDLHPAEAGLVRAEIIRVLASLDALHTSMAERIP